MAELVTVAELADALSITLDDANAGAIQVCDAASGTVLSRLTSPAEVHATHSWDREAALAVAIQVWQARQAPGGQMIGVDLGQYVSPHLLGPGLTARVAGLIEQCAIGHKPLVG